jgi:hypothetical protein
MQFYSAFVTVLALFTALIIFDVYNKETNLIVGHALFGIVSAAGVYILSASGSELTAWLILGTFAVLTLLGYVIKKAKERRAAGSPSLGPGGTPPTGTSGSTGPQPSAGATRA